MGFVADEQVEKLTYDFRPHADQQGEIPEPSSDQVDDYRDVIVEAMKATGLDPDELEGRKFTLADMDGLLEKNKTVEKAMVDATADLTGIAQSTLHKLPYRVQRAFLGWIMGMFFDPEG